MYKQTLHRNIIESPFEKLTMNFITLIGLIAAACTTLSFLPQAIETIQTKDTKSISFFMYALFTLGTFLWTIYGLDTHNLPIIFANSITMIFAIIILGYKIKYK